LKIKWTANDEELTAWQKAESAAFLVLEVSLMLSIAFAKPGDPMILRIVQGAYILYFLTQFPERLERFRRLSGRHVQNPADASQTSGDDS
jgi:hypothetical protein